MSTAPTTKRVRTIYEFIKGHRDHYSVQFMCRVLDGAPSGYYAWLQQPLSKHAQEDARLLRLIQASFAASHGIYGAPRVFLDLREAGETCSKHRVARLMRDNKLRALHGFRIRRWSIGKPSVLIPSLLQRQFSVSRPNKVWVTDITYIRTWQGWLYLAVVMDLFSRKIVGWSAGPNRQSADGVTVRLLFQGSTETSGSEPCGLARTGPRPLQSCRCVFARARRCDVACGVLAHHDKRGWISCARASAAGVRRSSLAP